MAKHLIGQGIGFSPGSVAYIIRDGLSAGAATFTDYIEIVLQANYDSSLAVKADYDTSVAVAANYDSSTAVLAEG